MSIKNLFDRTSDSKKLASKSVQELTSSIESVEYVEEFTKARDRLLPNLDFSKPANFARFGSAEQYYVDSIERIQKQYPYDGSFKEKLEWHNNSTNIDKYIFEKEYPRTNGFAIFSADGWGTQTAVLAEYGQPSGEEYIETKGGPHAGSGNTLKGLFPLPTSQKALGPFSNVLDAEETRESNLQFDLKNKGATVEFWLKKDGFDTAKTEKEVIFDLWNGEASSSSGFGRMTIELSGTAASESPFYVTVQSGTAGCFNQQIGSSIAGTGSLQEWNHYAISFASASSGISTKFYVNGDLNQSTVLGTSGIDEVTGSLISFIGALQTSPSGSTFDGTDMEGWGKLSGSLDEFRFWKTRRTSEEIGRFWFTQHGGGTNTDTSNTDLGIYYKFNEGITGYNNIDASVLDYSGRISNGTWTGYTSNSRNTGSAIVLASAAATEFKDPIIYADHPSVVSLLAEKKRLGSSHDYSNNASIYHTMPNWIVSDEEEKEGTNLLKLTQIISSYFDTVYSQIEFLSKVRDVDYGTGSFNKPLPFSNKLLESVGLVAPDIFVDADVLNQLSNRDEDREFEADLNDIKNSIYKNIYNNISFIYKSKGTEKSIRNLIRCFGVDDELVKLSLYGNNITHLLRDNYRISSIKKNYVDFNSTDRFNGTVYQYAPANAFGGPPDGTLPFIAAHEASGSSITAQAEVIFPKKFDQSSVFYFETPFLTSSLFGMHTAIDDSGATVDGYLAGEVNATWGSPDYANFQVYAVRKELESEDAYFMLTSSVAGIPTLTSSFYLDVYNNQKWNFAVRLRPEKYPLVDTVHGSTGSYVIEFTGMYADLGVVIEQFTVTGSVSEADGDDFLTSPKRLYVGAHRTNFSGSVLQNSDAKVSSARVWVDYLSNKVLEMHAKDASSHGRLSPYKNMSYYQSTLDDYHIPEIETLALNWDFEQVTQSDASGEFTVVDVSSGSAEHQQRYGWLGDITKLKHPGRGEFFLANDSQVVDREYINIYKQQLPENLYSSDMVEILERDDLTFTRETRPESYFFALEKSMYQTISEEMIKMFATIVDFNNLIGEPVHKYRKEYKDLDKLRSLFFERIQNTPDLDKYIDFYKWVDSAISELVMQLVPASIGIADRMRNVVESHILERNKYDHKFPTIEIKQRDPEDGAEGINRHLYNWKFGHAPVGGQENKNCFWWNERAEREPGASDSGDTEVNSDRTSILSASLQVLSRRFTRPFRYEVKEQDIFGGGTNSYRNKKYRAYSTIKPYDIDVSNKSVGIISVVESDKDCTDQYYPEDTRNSKFRAESKETKLAGLAKGKNKGGSLTPLSIFSSSANAWSQGEKEITALHQDSYGQNFDVPMQGPFTQEHVGGLQHRHVGLADETSSESNRPEGFKIILESPKYPDAPLEFQVVQPEIDSTTELLDMNLPKLRYYRDETAKRPVNIRNIETSTARSALGNYSSIREVVQTSNRKTNNNWFVQSASSENNDPPAILFDEDSFKIGTGSISTLGVLEYEKPIRGRNEHVFVERFSAPGGPETNGDVNGGIGLDALSAEYSVYNTINYRNNIVRTVLNQFSRDHSGQFGILNTESPRTEDYNTSASFQKTNRNTLYRLEYSDSLNETVVTASVYDNLFVQHPLPRDDNGVYWINKSALEGPFLIGCSNLVVQQGLCSEPVFPTGTEGSDGPDNLRLLGVLDSSGGPIADLVIDTTLVQPAFIPFNGVLLQPLFAEPRELGGTPLIRTFQLDISEQPLDQLAENIVVDLGTSEEPSDSINLDVLRSLIGDADATFGPDFNENNAGWRLSRRLNMRGRGLYSSWWQTRTGQHPVARFLRDTNIISTTQTTAGDPAQTNLRFFIEPPVSVRHKPMLHVFDADPSRTNIENVIGVKHTYGNNLSVFANTELNNLLNLSVCKEQKYDELKQLYLEVEDTENNPALFRSLSYAETIFPRDQYTFLDQTRRRQDFVVDFWRNSRANRQVNPHTNSLGFEIAGEHGESMWPLDSRFELNDPPTAAWQPGKVTSGPPQIQEYISSYQVEDGAGELQNKYCVFHQGLSATYNSGGVTSYSLNISGTNPAGLYNRRSSQVDTWSAGFLWLENGTREYFAGDAVWEAGTQSGKAPFYDSYNDYCEDIRRKGKDYSIVPEFRISEHIEYYLSEKAGYFRAEKEDLFTLTGSLLSSSAQNNFFKEYSHSEFLKYFELINEDHKGYSEPDSITLSCKAILKFLPYDGFYPATRTLEIGTLFSKSYADSLEPFVQGVNPVEGAGTENSASIGSRKNALRTFITPFMQPGILYNTIKSGIAVDWPIMTSSYEVTGAWTGDHFPVSSSAVMSPWSASVDYSSTSPNPNLTEFGGDEMYPRIKSSFDLRLPFESIYEPERYAKDIKIFDSEPHPAAALDSQVTWNGKGDPLYKMAIHNFLAETVDFFLEEQKLTSFSSIPEDSADFGNARAGVEYVMDVKLSRPFVSKNVVFASGSDELTQFFVNSQSFDMYSRPESFGPPMDARSIAVATLLPEAAGYAHVTPSYYDGDSWIRLKFKPTETKKYTVDEIVSNLTSSLFRRVDAKSTVPWRCWSNVGVLEDNENYYGDNLFFAAAAGDSLHHQNRMTPDAHIDFTNIIELPSKQYDIDSGDETAAFDADRTKVWNISTKFETPVLNFSHRLGTEIKDPSIDSATGKQPYYDQSVDSDYYYDSSNYGPDASIPPGVSFTDKLPIVGGFGGGPSVGLWHQYGEIPESIRKTVTLEIADLSRNSISNINTTGSLADLVGMRKQKKAIGSIAQSKTIKEAVVAVPFTVSRANSQRQFFELDRQVVEHGLRQLKENPDLTVEEIFNKNNSTGAAREFLVGKSILSMLKKMNDYVFPPQMNFLQYDDVKPFAMYIFEFEKVLDQQDLADIWQNLPPDIGTTFEMKESTVSHNLFNVEFFGRYSKPEDRRDGEEGMTNDLRWMIFKVKQKAKTNFYETTAKSKDDKNFKFNLGRDPELTFIPEYSYNWPYDFFSLVELIKLDAEVTWGDQESIGSLPAEKKQTGTVTSRSYTKEPGFLETYKDGKS